MADTSQMVQAGSLLNPDTGSLDYEAFQKRIQEASASTGEVQGGESGIGNLTNLYKTAKDYQSPELKSFAGTVLSDAQAELAGMQESAKINQFSTEMAGAMTESQLKNLDAFQTSLAERQGQLSGYWAEAINQADEYAQAALTKVSEAFDKVEGIFREWQGTRDANKAQAMQAGVQALDGSIGEQEREIARLYGPDSAEYQAFQGTKVRSLSTLFSNIQAQWQQMSEQAYGSFMQAGTTLLDRMNMYASFQEQQHVEMIKSAAAAEQATYLQTAQLELATIAAKGTVWQSMMDHLNNMTVPVFEVTPYASIIMDSIMDYQDRKQAEAQWRQSVTPQVWTAKKSSRTGSF